MKLPIVQPGPSATPKKVKKSKKEEKVFPLHNYPADLSKGQQLELLFSEWYACERCDLSQTREGSDICFGVGNPDAKVMLIGEGPGEEEVRTSTPFIGPAGKLLNQMLAYVSDDTGIQNLYQWYAKAPRTRENVDHFHNKLGEWRDKEFFVTNVVACRPPGEKGENRPPTKFEAEACFERLNNLIYIIDPWLIVTLGKSAAENVIKKNIEISVKHGELYDVEFTGRLTKFQKPVVPCLHPSFLLRQSDFNVRGGWYAKTIADLHQAMRIYDEMKYQYLGVPIPHRLGGE